MDVIMPQLGETVAEGVVTKWYKKVGDTVKSDDTLFDVETDKVSTEITYLVTSLDAAEAGPKRLLALKRGHWAIENRLHWVRDVSMNEDRCRVRAGGRALAALRNLMVQR